MFLFVSCFFFFFFFQAEDGIRDPLVTGVQTCALPISRPLRDAKRPITLRRRLIGGFERPEPSPESPHRSEEHTSELQSRVDLVCRLLLEKKNIIEHKMSVIERITDRCVSLD